ncbi:hypothetical protein LTR94_037657, partial [Friedmanniomyces endolithicus]
FFRRSCVEQAFRPARGAEGPQSPRGRRQGGYRHGLSPAGAGGGCGRGQRAVRPVAGRRPQVPGEAL